MPEPATPLQSATAAPLRPSRNGSAPPLPAKTGHERPQWSARLAMAVTRLGTITRRLLQRS